MAIELSVGNISDLIKSLDGLKTEIDNSTNVVVQKLVEKGGEIANQQNTSAPQSGLQKSTVVSVVTESGKKGYVALRGPSAVYDEFGTGTEGTKDAHPLKGQTTRNLNPYNSGPQIRYINQIKGKGWYYPPMQGKPYYDLGKNGLTQGIPSGKQIYTACNYVKFIKKPIVQSEFNSMIKRINIK